MAGTMPMLHRTAGHQPVAGVLEMRRVGATRTAPLDAAASTSVAPTR